MTEQPIQRPKPATIGVYLVHGGQLAAECRTCRHWRGLDMEMLAERLGRDHSTLAPDLAPEPRCSRCRSRDVALQAHGALPAAKP